MRVHTAADLIVFYLASAPFLYVFLPGVIFCRAFGCFFIFLRIAGDWTDGAKDVLYNRIETSRALRRDGDGIEITAVCENKS